MALHVFDFGDGAYRLHADGREVGWVAGRAVGFRGFESVRAAVGAATTAYDVLGAWLARLRRAELAPRRRRVLRVRGDGKLTWLTLGGVPVGRIVQMDGDDAGDARDFAFELLMPPALGPVLALRAAQVAHAALEQQGASSVMMADPVAAPVPAPV
ncbi:MAG TPA: hypothetical protein VFS05_15140 [Gemmatimonadaceae bacterium]|nr:hypothetical protein [Gemmatimonadaceae bacterium]